MGFYGNATYYLPNGIAQDVAKGVITTEKLAEDAVTKSKIAPKAIHGSKGTKLDDNNIHSSHIATKTIGGGDNGDIAFDTITGGSAVGKGNIASGTIQNYNIKDGTIGKEKLNTTYLETKIDLHQKTISNITQLFEFCNKTINNNQLSRIFINQEIKWPNNENFNIVIIPAYYLAIKFHIWIILLDTNSGKFYQIEKNDTQITNIKTTKLEGYYNIVNDTITGGSAVGEGNIAGGTIQGYNIKTKTIQGTGENNNIGQSHIAEATIGQANMADNAIGTNQIINNSIHGSGDNVDFPNYQHISEGSIGTNDIANHTITPEKLEHVYWRSNSDLDVVNSWEKLVQALPLDASYPTDHPTLAFLITNLANWNEEPTPIFPQGCYMGVRLTGGPIYLFGCSSNENYEIKISEKPNIKVEKQIQYKIQGKNIDLNSIGTDQIIENSISGSGKDEGKNHIAPGSIGTDDIAKNAITPEKMDRKYLEYKEQVITVTASTIYTLLDTCKILPSNVSTILKLTKDIYYENNSNMILPKTGVLKNGLYRIVKGDSITNINLLHLATGIFYTLNIDSNDNYEIYTTYLSSNNIGKDSVGEEQIVNNSVISDKIKQNSIYGSKSNVKNHIVAGTIGEKDIAFDVITGGHYPGMGNIAEKTIYGYNIADDTISPEKLTEKYLSYKASAMSYSSLETLKTDLNQSLDQMLYFNIVKSDLDLPLGYYLALPQIGIPALSQYRVVFHMETGISYMIKELSNKQVIAYSIDATATNWNTQTSPDLTNNVTNSSYFDLYLKDYTSFTLPFGLYNDNVFHNIVQLAVQGELSFLDRCKITLPYDKTLSIVNQTGYTILFSFNGETPRTIYNENKLWDEQDKIIDSPIFLEIEFMSNQANPGKYLICKAWAEVVE